MAKKSKKKAKASRENGSKGQGPITPEGKQAVRFNALKDGLFTKEIIVEAAGERKEDFERLKEEMWKFFEPENPLEEMLVTDVIENRWRLQRVRRAESINLQKRLGFIADSNLSSLNLATSQRIQTLQAKFLSFYEKYILFASDAQRPIETLDIGDQLEEIRQELVSTSGGVEFLIDQLRSVQGEARSNGYVSPEREMLLLACCGLWDKTARLCSTINRATRSKSAPSATTTKPDSGKFSKEDVDFWRFGRAFSRSVRETEEAERKITDAASAPPKADRDYGAGKDEAPRAGRKKDAKRAEEQSRAEGESTAPDEGSREVLVSCIEACIGPLIARKRLLLELEGIGLEAQKAEAIVEAGRSERFLRAETAIERRLYRALAMIVAIKQAQSLPPSVPAATNETDRLPPSSRK